MLNKDNIRELAYIVSIDEIKPIPGRDKVECAVVNGWTIMVRKGQFKPGDLGIYFEIDSKVPEKEPFYFLAPKHYKIKTQKYALKDENGNKVGQFWSQGLLMSAEDFGWELFNTGQFAGGVNVIDTKEEGNDRYLGEGDFLTQKLEVTYAVSDDNKRKGNGPDKYKKMAARHPQLFKNPIIKMIYKTNWGKKLLFVFFGKKKMTSWPEWVVKTDEERVQNMPWILNDKSLWIATEKIDGTSTTFTLKKNRKLLGENDYRVCSRNVCFDKPDKKCYYDTTAGNVYLEMSEKYHMEEVLTTLLDQEDDDIDFITIQGETYGKQIQKRDYGLKDHDLAVFNLIFGYNDGTVKRFNPSEMTFILNDLGVPCVPIVNDAFVLPDTVEELLNIATDKSMIDGGMREGLVFRSLDGEKSFKAVSNEFLMKYHNK